MKVVFFGTPAFAVPALEQLISSRHEVLAVVTQPDRPAGRGQKIRQSPTKEIALREGIIVLQPERVKAQEFLDEFRTLGADVGIVVAYGQILPQALLDIPRFGFLNIHPSLLPKYRGAAPIEWSVVRGETKTGVTIMQVEAGLDSGPIVKVETVDILDDDDARSLANLLSLMGAKLLVESLDEIDARGSVVSTPQDHDAMTYAPLIKKADARVDWNREPETIIRQIRGFVVWPQATARINGMDVKLLGADAVDPKWIAGSWSDDRVPVGTVVDTLDGRGLVVKVGGGSGLVLVTRIKPAGKKEMAAGDAINGGLIEVGNRFETDES